MDVQRTHCALLTWLHYPMLMPNKHSVRSDHHTTELHEVTLRLMQLGGLSGNLTCLCIRFSWYPPEQHLQASGGERVDLRQQTLPKVSLFMTALPDEFLHRRTLPNFKPLRNTKHHVHYSLSVAMTSL